MRLSLNLFSSVHISWHVLPFLSASVFDVYFLQVMTQQKAEGETLILAFEFQNLRPNSKKKDVKDCVMIEELGDSVS